MVSKLIQAKNEIEDAIQLSKPSARYDPAVVDGPTLRALGDAITIIETALRKLEEVR